MNDQVNILLDADIIAYQIAAVSESVYDFDGGGDNLAVVLHPDRIGSLIEAELESLCAAVGASRVYVCLSDPSSKYFRHRLDPTYKSARRSSRKPELLQAVKNYLSGEYQYWVRDELEADDVMGILATHPSIIEGTNIIVSSDKDMRTIPGKLYNPGKPDLGVIDISLLDANRFLLWQAIVGDTTDGYPGCPGVGEKSDFAQELMVEDDPEELWNIVIDCYASKGLTEDDAIHQVRLARILRSCDYNFRTKKPKLWNPTKLFWDQ